MSCGSLFSMLLSIFNNNAVNNIVPPFLNSMSYDTSMTAYTCYHLVRINPNINDTVVVMEKYVLLNKN